MKYRELRNALSQKGFRMREGSKHEKYLYFDPSGQKTSVLTALSRKRGSSDVTRPIEGQIAQQLKLTIHEFREFVECRIDHHEYDRIRSE